MAMSPTSARGDVEPRAGEAPGKYERWRLEAVARGLRLLAVPYRGVLRRRQDGQGRLGGLSGRAAVEHDFDLNYVRPG
jgi:hypothetical protein